MELLTLTKRASAVTSEHVTVEQSEAFGGAVWEPSDHQKRRLVIPWACHYFYGSIRLRRCSVFIGRCGKPADVWTTTQDVKERDCEEQTP